MNGWPSCDRALDGVQRGSQEVPHAPRLRAAAVIGKTCMPARAWKTMGCAPQAAKRDTAKESGVERRK
jgi:hypothetical protein